MQQGRFAFLGLDTGHAVPDQRSYPLDKVMFIIDIWPVFT